MDAGGNRLDAAPIKIVRNPAASDPTVRNGLSCIGCHTEGMKAFEDQVRGVVEQNPNPPYDKARALRLYAEKSEMDELLEEDAAHYRQALEATGDVFGGIEPVQRFYEAFQRPLDVAHAAAAVGLETETFLQRIRSNKGLQNLGVLVLANDTMKRDTWTSKFSQVVFALDFPSRSASTVLDPQTEIIPGASVHIPNPTLRAAIEEVLGKAPGAPITVEDMTTLTTLHGGGQPPQDLEGIQFATNLEVLSFGNGIEDLSPLAGLTKLERLSIFGSPSDLSPLAGLTKLERLWISMPPSDLSPLAGLTSLTSLRLSTGSTDNVNLDISPLAGLTELQELHLNDSGIYDISPLAGLTELRVLNLGNLNPGGNRIFDISPLAGLTKLQRLQLAFNPISDISPLSALINLEVLDLSAMYYYIERQRFNTTQGVLSDISPLAGLTKLRHLGLRNNGISDISPLSSLINLIGLDLRVNNISDVSPLANLQGLSRPLNLFGNNISDVSPLANLQKLPELQIQYNEISDISPLDGLHENTRIFWYGNPGFPQGGPKIEGPWLWMFVPEIPHLSSTISENDVAKLRSADWLSLASDGAVTELAIAANGATEGRLVGEHIWTSHKIAPTNPDQRSGNIWTMLRAIGIKQDLRPDHAVYGSVNLYSQREQKTNMFAGSTGAHKVWLNGKLVRDWSPKHKVFDDYTDYEDFFPVMLKQGQNILLVAVYSGKAWNYASGGDFGFEPGTEYQVSVPSVGYTLSKPSIHVGDPFILDLSAENVQDLAGWQFDIVFDPAVLEVVEVNEGDFLKEGGGATFFQKGTIDNTTGKITKLSSVRLSEDGASGTGTLLSGTFTAKRAGQTQLRLENFQLAAITGESIPAEVHEFVFTVEGQLTTGDINRDGQVSILDMIFVARYLGEDASANPQADINGDGTISILDLILVAQHLGETTAAAPSLLAVDDIQGLDPAMIQAWIERAQVEDDGSIAFQRGIAYLQSLLASLIPEETALLPNYPNPFNPETWIPYQLSKPAEVTLRIYAVNGVLVRTLALGQTPAGIYQSRSRAAYWDGRNNVGESVASGIYFYTLTAGDFTATRKLLIRK